MDANLKKVFVCFDERAMTKDFVIDDIASEQHPYAFNFDMELARVNDCDEFWVFGDVVETECYKKAVELGKDIWRMM